MQLAIQFLTTSLKGRFHDIQLDLQTHDCKLDLKNFQIYHIINPRYSKSHNGERLVFFQIGSNICVNMIGLHLS
ncbi:LOW QUALITY PROTEIN: hypothetical protein V1477_011521 [Vespula maculifrons]|uniref:Uncharacterized protein n=1 Tax=Vespula maculifrons TaxID=7453 RepID=A0ABD2BZF2_VESMC